MQIAGTKCKVCGQNIILSSEGKFCTTCGSAVHLTCDPNATCGICGKAYELYERPQSDALRDALLPPALRPSRSGGPALAIGLGVALLLLVIIIWYAIESTISQGK
jgi:hypothetical protein